MRYLVLISLFILFCSFVSAEEVFPLNYYSDKTYNNDNSWTYHKYGFPKYYTEDGYYRLIDSNFQGYLFEEWKYQVNKGLYNLGVKDDATIGFKYKNKGITLKLIGLGFYNSDTKERIIRTGLNFVDPVVDGNRITWELPYNSNYFIEYKNKSFRDVLVVSQQIKNFLWNNRPDGWNTENTWVGLIYDANGYNLQLNDFDSNETVYFLDGNQVLFYLPERKVYHELHQSGEGDFNNDGREWQKKRIYFNGHYIEAIPISALESESGFLYWNAIITINVAFSEDDGEETNLGAINTTNNSMDLDGVHWGIGILFREIDLDQGVTIAQAILTVTHGFNCSGVGGCDTDWFGVDTHDANAWSSSNKMSDQIQTTATTVWDLDGSFSPNSSWSTSDINVTAIVQEIVDLAEWENADFNMGFVNKGASFCRGCDITVNTFDNAFTPEPEIEITFEGLLPDPCKPDINEDWVFIDNTLICVDKNIFVGTGNFVVDDNSSLTLINSDLFLGSFVTCLLPNLDQNLYTQDGNIQASSEFLLKVNASFPFKGHNPHVGNAWVSGLIHTDHWIRVDLNEQFFIKQVYVPFYFSLNTFSDVNIEIYNDVNGWTLLWENNDFNMWDDTGDNCDWTGQIGSTQLAYCDKTFIINDWVQIIEIQVDKDSHGEGFIGTDFDSYFGVDDIVLTAKKPVKYACLVLDGNSFFSGDS